MKSLVVLVLMLVGCYTPVEKRPGVECLDVAMDEVYVRDVDGKVGAFRVVGKDKRGTVIERGPAFFSKDVLLGYISEHRDTSWCFEVSVEQKHE